MHSAPDSASGGATNGTPDAARRVVVLREGPILVEGPVEIQTETGTVVSDRFLVALCACRRSRRYPFCDTSHRRRVRDSEPRHDADHADDADDADDRGDGDGREAGGDA